MDRENRRFKTGWPNRLGASDFPYVPPWPGWLYVAFVIDAFTRLIVGERIFSLVSTVFVLDALDQSLYARRPDNDGTLLHSSYRRSR